MKKIKLFTPIISLALLFGVLSLNNNTQKIVAVIEGESAQLFNENETIDLDLYKRHAILQINKVNLSLYRTAEASEVTTLINETTVKINSCQSINEVDSVVSSFDRYLLTIKTDAQLTQEEEERRQEEEAEKYHISSYEELLAFRDDVNSGYSYQDETIVLTNDIVVPAGKPFSPIGPSEAKAFAGTFDGNNHKISGLTLSGATVGFIYFGTKCTIKNLIFENVNITATTQRAAGVISRADAVTLDNIHITSGTITGPTQSGGLIGALVGKNGDSIIKNCSNNATVQTTETAGAASGGVAYVFSGGLSMSNFENTGLISTSTKSAGGFIGHIASSGTTVNVYNCNNTGSITGSGLGVSGGVGFSAGTSLTIESCANSGTVINSGEATGGLFGYSASVTKATSIIVRDSVNTGSISGQSNGTGGVVGAHNASATYMTFIVDGCTNRGSVNGLNYVGGVVGLIRNSTADSYINNCFNYGNVTASSTATTVGCGGVVGTARVNLTNSGCYYNVTLSAKSNTKAAADLSELGTPGFIALNYETNCKTHTNNRLIDANGNDYVA